MAAARIRPSVSASWPGHRVESIEYLLPWVSEALEGCYSLLID